MRSRSLLWLFPLVALVFCGCWETRETVTLNPDGSGKVAFETITALPLDPTAVGEKKEITDPQDEARKAVGKMLNEAKGVEAWSDLAFSVQPDGRIRLQGVAFFPDYSKLKLPWSGGSARWEKTDKGMALSAEMWTDPTKNEPVNEALEKPAVLTPEEIQKQVLVERMEYRQVRPMLAAMLESLKSDRTFVLPGRVGDFGAFAKTPQGLQIAFEGKKMLEAWDAMEADDELMAMVAREAKSSDKSGVEEYLAEKVLGRKGRLRAVVTGDLKALFDYPAQSRKALEGQEEMLETLNIKLGTASEAH
ncbi:MAG: hypothetical protein ACXW5U_05505 [Thermoanaerobaculia bacterium]